MTKKTKICIDCGELCSGLRCKRCQGLSLGIPVEKRFWNKVDKNGPIMSHMSTPCWIWLASKNAGGYGLIGINNKTELAHRISYLMHHGELRDLILHSCDNPSCVNPEHLYIGNAKDNAKDMHKRGRYVLPPTGDKHWTRKDPEKADRVWRSKRKNIAKGERQGLSVLTEKQVKEIREIYQPYKISISILAKRYGVGTSTIHSVIKRQTWKHI